MDEAPFGRTLLFKQTLRLPRFVLRLLVTASALLVLPISQEGCAQEKLVGENAGGGNSTEAPGAAGDSPDTRNLAEDSGMPKGAEFRWNPLCRVLSTSQCMPDDDGASVRLGATCATPTPEAGTSDAAAPPGSGALGCRVKRTSPSVFEVGCEAATFGGLDGVSCTHGSDCAPGFDCVEGPRGASCRRYCCAGTCDGSMAQNGGPTFCDVQKLVDPGSKAPVCLPLKRCKLLTPGECADSETCAVVSDGETGCVARGDAQIGNSCDEQHCAADLTCLGQPGNRKCFQLCRLGAAGSSPACAAPQVCKTTTVFKDNSFGVCVP